MTGFSLPAFRNFCAAKPEGEEYDLTDAGHPVGHYEAGSTQKPFDNGYLKAVFRCAPYPRTYGALTARLDALIGEK